MRHPHIYKQYKRWVPEHLSKEAFWQEYCRWVFKLPVDLGTQKSAQVDFEECIKLENSKNVSSAVFWHVDR